MPAQRFLCTFNPLPLLPQRVGVHTTLMHYYFEDKRSLFVVPWGARPDGTFEHTLPCRQRHYQAGRRTLRGH